MEASKQTTYQMFIEICTLQSSGHSNVRPEGLNYPTPKPLNNTRNSKGNMEFSSLLSLHRIMVNSSLYVNQSMFVARALSSLVFRAVLWNYRIHNEQTWDAAEFACEMNPMSDVILRKGHENIPLNVIF